MVVTGSYDDRVRLIRCPTVGRREVLAELDLGGGVWEALGTQTEWFAEFSRWRAGVGSVWEVRVNPPSTSARFGMPSLASARNHDVTLS